MVNILSCHPPPQAGLHVNVFSLISIVSKSVVLCFVKIHILSLLLFIHINSYLHYAFFDSFILMSLIIYYFLIGLVK